MIDHIIGTALIVIGSLWLARTGLRTLAAWSEREVDRHVERALAAPLPGLDAPDEAFEQWARDALRIANSAAFEADVRADIAALPTSEEIA